MVAKMSDDDIWALRRGGHDPQKVYAAYHKAVNHKGQPTVLLIKTVKGFGMGKAGEGKNNVHQTKKLTDEDIKILPRPLQHPDPDSELAEIPFYKPADDTPEMRTCTSAARPGRLPAAPSHQGRRELYRALAGDLQERDGAHGRGPRDFHHPGLRALPDAAAARPGAGPARGAHPGG
jgi:pyruvate dehydrogenase complex dehydrogenase (E1) component